MAHMGPMGASGPRSGSAPVATRTTRSSTANGRGSSRGAAAAGIHKRRGGAPKTDRDGDLVMDAAASANGGPSQSSRGGIASGRGARSLNRNAQSKAIQGVIRSLRSDAGDITSRVPAHLRAQLGPTTVIKILGLKASKASTNRDGGLRGLLEFLERKASSRKKVTIKKSLLRGDFVYILVAKDDAPDLLRLNDYSYAGAQLTITESDEPWPGATTEPALSDSARQAKEGLRNVLSGRYDVNRKLLDLSSLSADPNLNQMGIFQQTDKINLLEKAFKALLVVCDQQFTSAQAKRDSIPSISLASNNISNVAQVFELADTFPDLKHLDFSNNQIDSLRKVGRWRHRFRSLETLILSGNPIEQAEPSYKTEVLTWFPKLQILDGVQVRTPDQIQAADAALRPTPIPQSGFDFRDAGGVGEQFIKQFFSMYDTNRQQLASVFYDENSTFSVAVTTSAPHETGSAVPNWHAYIRYSRNLSKITTLSGRQQRLFKGAPLIEDLWKRLPVTKHPNLETETDKYVVDCHLLPGLADISGQSPQGVDGLIITVHGEFEEIDPQTNKTGMRGFTRTFVLGPGAPGKSPVRVVSDLLALRAHTPVPHVLPSPGPAMAVPQAQAPAASMPAAAAAPAAAAPMAMELERKRQMVIELSKRTNMTLIYSERCLDEVNWDFDGAWQAFERNKANLPADAFAALTA